jgi:hypothetical protein
MNSQTIFSIHGMNDTKCSRESLTRLKKTEASKIDQCVWGGEDQVEKLAKKGA